MLADPKARALTDNFASQWLLLRNLKSHVPTPGDYPNFDNELRQAFRQETELFFASIVRDDRSVLDLIDANYTYVNERLARHYGIPNVYGSNFRRVTLTNEARRGLLGQGSVLVQTSLANRTSPVLRGKWVLDNVLGAPPPPPPAVVPPLKEDDKAGRQRALSMREKMEAHRANPTCASCHKIMDPIGLALENFDAVGAYRERDGQSLSSAGTVIDAKGQLMDGSTVDGVTALRKALLKDPEVFVGALTEKLMTYAMGRGVAYYDMPTVRGIVREARRSHYSFGALVSGIVQSAAFQMRMKSTES
jgi:hypothetical protein